ncbi:MAG TPA: PAS domain S-box protein [Steroidobacteraceae bacterium]|nr:PAS domain S-box protein [Steroidobacteraceae bacterium]
MDDVKDRAAQISQLPLRRVRAYLIAVAAPAAALLVRYVFSFWTGDRPFQILFVVPMIVSAYLGGLGPGLLATALSALAMDWFAIQPVHSFAITQPVEVIYWCLLILVGVLISILSGALHRSRADNQNERRLRARAEQALAELDRSQQLVTAIVDNSAAVIYVKDLEGRYLLVNRRYEEAFHFDREAILGKSDHDLFAAEDADRYRTLDQRVAAGGIALTEEETVQLDGAVRTFLSVKSPLRDATGAVYGTFGISTDITERRQAEETAMRFAAIVESSDDAIISKDLRGIITGWNRGAEKIFGYATAEALGKPMLMLFPLERIDEEPAIIERIRRGENVDHFETVRLRKDGARIDVSVTISPVRDERGQVIGASSIARDITERKLALEAVRQSEVRYRTLFDTLMEGFCTVEMIFDAAGKPVDFRYLEVNPAFETQTGLKDVQGQLVTDLIPDLESHWFETFGRVAVTGEPVHFENEAKGLERYYDVNAYRVGGADSPRVAILFNDITARRAAETKARHHLVRLELLNRITRAIGERQDIQSIFQVTIRTLEENLPADLCCICLHDATEQRLVVTSVGTHSAPLAMTLALTEQARIDIQENSLAPCLQGRLIYEPDITHCGAPLARRLTEEGLRSLVVAPLLVESQVFGVLIAARQQQRAFNSADCEFLKQLSEHVALAAHQAQLYTALQVAYDDLRQTQKAVMQHERLMALGQMASGIAHDINNAISPVQLYTESLLATEQTLSPRARGQLEIILRAIEDVGQTVARMREFYRPLDNKLAAAPVELNRLVQQVVELTRARWSDMAHQRGVSIEMRLELAPELPAMLGSEGELREALTNLVFNAVDAMPDGGPLTVRTALAGKSNTIVLEVIDSGVGMDEITRRRCLEPFFTTKGERGTGLGLAMVYGTMKRHGAEIEIDSTPGKGTTMRLSFTAATGPVTTATPLVQAAVVPTRILIIDDDPLVLKSLCDALESDGHQVTTANGGQEGIDAFRAAQAQGRPFPVVITDLGMPYVDGRKVSGAIKAAAPETSIVLLTGWGQRLVAEGDIPPHTDRVLSKPAKLRELREVLASL